MKLYSLDNSWSEGGIVVVAENREQAKELILQKDSWADVDTIQEHDLVPGLVVVIEGRRSPFAGVS